MGMSDLRRKEEAGSQARIDTLQEADRRYWQAEKERMARDKARDRKIITLMIAATAFIFFTLALILTLSIGS